MLFYPERTPQHCSSGHQPGHNRCYSFFFISLHSSIFSPGPPATPPPRPRPGSSSPHFSHPVPGTLLCLSQIRPKSKNRTMFQCCSVCCLHLQHLFLDPPRLHVHIWHDDPDPRTQSHPSILQTDPTGRTRNQNIFAFHQNKLALNCLKSYIRMLAAVCWPPLPLCPQYQTVMFSITTVV